MSTRGLAAFYGITKRESQEEPSSIPESAEACAADKPQETPKTVSFDLEYLITAFERTELEKQQARAKEREAMKTRARYLRKMQEVISQMSDLLSSNPIILLRPAWVAWTELVRLREEESSRTFLGRLRGRGSYQQVLSKLRLLQEDSAPLLLRSAWLAWAGGTLRMQSSN